MNCIIYEQHIYGSTKSYFYWKTIYTFIPLKNLTHSSFKNPKDRCFPLSPEELRIILLHYIISYQLLFVMLCVPSS